MSQLSHTRIAAASGLAFVLLDSAALFLPGAPPRASDSARDIAATLAAHRGQLLAGTYLAGMAAIALLLFLAALHAWLTREGSDAPLGLAAVLAGLFAIGVQMVGLLLFYGAAYSVAGQHDYALVRALTDGGNAGVEMSKFGFAALVAGVCLSGRRALSPTMFSAGLLSAALLLVSAVPLFAGGRLTEFGGGLDLAGGAPATLWLAALSVMLTLRRPESLALADARAA